MHPEDDVVSPRRWTAQQYIDHAGHRLPESLRRPTKRWLQRRESDQSRANYARDLGVTEPRCTGCRGAGSSWLPWCLANGVNPTAATFEDVQDWLDHLRVRGFALASRSRMLSIVSSWYDWLAYRDDERPIDYNPVARVDRRNYSRSGDPSQSIALDEKQTSALLTSAFGDRQHGVPSRRSHALISLFLGTGMRCGELAALTTAAWTRHDGRAQLWVDAVSAKGSKSRWVEVPPAAENALRAYLAQRNVDLDNLPQPPAPLFATRSGAPMRECDIRATVKRIARNGPPAIRSVADWVHPHTLRHTYVTQSLQAGVPLEVVQDAAGHASPATTRVYDHSVRGGRSPADVMGQLMKAASETFSFKRGAA